MASSHTVLYRERFEGIFGVLPGEVAPRLLVIGDFPAGPAGLTAPGAGAGMGREAIRQFFSNGVPNYNTDFIDVYAGQTYGGSGTGAIDIYRVVASDATAATANFADESTPGPIAIGTFEAVGPGTAYNGLTITMEVVEVLTSHPSAPVIPVFDIFVQSPNPNSQPEEFRRIVFTTDGSGTNAYHRVRDAEVINATSFIVDFLYDPDIATADFSSYAVGDVVLLTLAGGSDGAALDDEDYEAAIDATGDLPFRWRVIPNAPTPTLNNYLHSVNKASPYGHAILIQPYGTPATTLIADRLPLGSEADDGKSSFVFAWGAHPLAGNREVPYAAAYFGLYSAKINSSGLGGEYPVGGTGLGFLNIASGDELTPSDREALSQVNIMFGQQNADGSYGVHGSWTMDNQLDRMGDLGVRIMWNDIIRRLVLQFSPLAHNRGRTTVTMDRIQSLGDAAIRPYLSVGWLSRAATGVVAIEEAAATFPGTSWPSLPGWAAYLASLRMNPTLQGVYIHVTDADINGLASLSLSAPTATEGAAA